MGTHAIVAWPTDSGTGWAGRYVHWDGYPEHMVPTLQDIVKNHGVVSARETIDKYREWSVLMGGDQGYETSPGPTIGVPGFGEAYDDAEDALYTSDGSYPADHVYVLQDDGILYLGESTQVFAYNSKEG